MNSFNQAITRSQEAVLDTNKVIKNTYMLLSATLLFSAAMAAVGVATHASFGASLAASIAAIGLIWLVLPKVANSGKGIAVVFAFTGLLGYSLGPMLTHYMNMPNGGQLVSTALGGTGAIFLALSGYALTTRKDFSFMGGFLFVGLIVAMVAIIANIFLQIPALMLAINVVVVLIMSGMILFDTSRIINGGERNYLFATVSLYMNIHNLFIHLLSLLSAFSGDD